MTRAELYKLINQCFAKVFILTIEEATERHKHIREHLQGLDYEFVFGVNKSFMKAGFSPNDLTHLQTFFTNEDVRYLIWSNPAHIEGMAACAEGHKRIYERIIQEGFESALIFEDDVVLDEIACSAASSFSRRLPSRWELIYLGYTGGVRMNPRWSLPVRWGLYHAKNLLGVNRRFKQPVSRPVNASFDTAGYQAGGYAYAVTNEAARKLLSVQSPLTFSADGALIFSVKNNLICVFVHKKPLFTDATYFNTAIKLPSLLNY